MDEFVQTLDGRIQSMASALPSASARYNFQVYI